MAFLHFNNVRIAALSGAVPDYIQKINLDPNHPQAPYIANFVKQTGVKQRHISIREQTATDLGYIATNTALERAGWTPESLDGLIFLTQTPDFNPATGNCYVLHNHLKMRQEALVFDIAQGCASFPYGLAVCASLLQQPAINRIAMVSGDSMWPAYPDKDSLLGDPFFLAGEGSTALLLEKNGNDLLNIALYNDGSGYNFLYGPLSGVRNAWRKHKGILPNGAEYSGYGQYMDGLEITSFATLRVVDSIKNFLDHIGASMADYDGLILHQANLQIVKTMGRRLKVDKTKMPIIVDRFANTNGASVTLTMVDAYAGRTDMLRLLVSAFGVGLSWGIVDMKLDSSVITPMRKTDFRFEEDYIKQA